MSAWDTAKKMVCSRDQWLCVRCERPATDCHHRKPRKMGGTRNAETNYGLANLVSLCRACHSYVHDNPAWAYGAGYLVHEGDDPEDVLIELGCGRQLRLRNDGIAEETGECELF